jgi:enoyl-CoA hydratase/carnithine racemase
LELLPMAELIYEKRERYAIMTMNRPHRLNAFGGSMMAELSDAMLDFNADPALRAAIITGQGRAYSAGADLKEIAEHNARRGDGPAASGMLNRGNPAARFSRSPKPIIAAINGLCIAAGLEQVLDCDIRICSEEAYFALTEVKRGILASGGVRNLPRIIPYGDAMYLLLTGDRIGPQQALRYGLVQEVVAPERVLPRAIEIAEMIAQNAPLAVEGTKAVAQYWRHLQIEESRELNEWVNRVVLASEDAKEGPRAFAEKREPRWKGK